MPNALASESSPYLLQHQNNPVSWLPWGDHALARARAEDKPLLVSIGYSACHWCHVMERESFEDERTAELMNSDFVCVKVDREERPDIDAIYMAAVQAIAGHGGWPLNVFLTPDQEPFYGGTYFPPTARHGIPAWRDVLYSVAKAWREQPDEIAANVGALRARLQAETAHTSGTTKRAGSEHDLDDAVRSLAASFDEHRGGFGTSPKFPPSCALAFLMTQAHGSSWSDRARAMTRHTLQQMAIGGIHDQAGGGFARYAVDANWSVPHFEKMLYDNALLLRAYARGHLIFEGDQDAAGDPASTQGLFAETATAIGDWALREMQAADGGFISALDADSEGHEGLFYTWTPEQLGDALGELEQPAMRWLSTVPFEGRLILEARGGREHLTRAERDEIRKRLLQARSPRVRPGADSKRLAAWNGLMIGALAEAGTVLDNDRWIAAASAAAAFVLATMRDDDGRLLRTSDGQTARLNGYLEDHAFLVEGLLDLYEATFEPRWFLAAQELADAMIERFSDPDGQGFYSTSSDHERLLMRRKEIEDNPIPSGSSSAALGLLRLAALTGEQRYEGYAVGTLALAGELAPRYAHGFGHMLQALDFHVRPVREVALVGDDITAFRTVLRSNYRPRIVLAGTPGEGIPLMDHRTTVDGVPAAYVCERFACKAPVTDPAQLVKLLDG